MNQHTLDTKTKLSKMRYKITRGQLNNYNKLNKKRKDWEICESCFMRTIEMILEKEELNKNG